MYGILTAAANHGRYIPEKPIVSYLSYGKFKIDNYISYQYYSASDPTVRFDGNIITLPAVDMSVAIYAGPPKRGIVSPAALAARESIKFHKETETYDCTTTVVEWCSCGPLCNALNPANPANCSCYTQPSSQSWGQCGIVDNFMCWYGGQCTRTRPGTCQREIDVETLYYDQGYTRTEQEWWKVG